MDKSKELAALDDDQLDAVAGGGGLNVEAALEKYLDRVEDRILTPVKIGEKIMKAQLQAVGDGLTNAGKALEAIGGKISGFGD